MAEQPRLITVAIHTYDRAIALKSLLEREGVAVTLQNVNLSHPVASSGVRLRINESDLPLALRIIENQDIFDTAAAQNAEKPSPLILVPVDFSVHSEKACDVAFRMAARHKAEILLMHSFVDPLYSNKIQLADVLSFDAQSSDIDARMAIEQEANRQMDILCNSLLEKIKSGKIPAVKFSTEIAEGLPEELINQKAKVRSPLMIVMGTRGAGTKEREMVGSVTAEVLDTCRYPVFTVPESVTVTNMNQLDSVLFFSNFDQEDILAIEALLKLMPLEKLNIVLVKIPGKKNNSELADEALNRLGEYCRKHYPAHNFAIDTLSINSIDEDFNRITEGGIGKLIAVPNKKKNIFARLFNPGIAHRILFHSDIPMLVIPV